jgi:hypothetical protein
MHVCTREYRLNPNFSTLEHDLSQYDRHAACVISQQYSSATFFSLRFHLGKEKVGAFQQCIISVSSPLFVTLLKVCKFGIA